MFSGHLETKKLNILAKGLNIEGPRPYRNLPAGCKWLNLIVVVDEPLSGTTFDDVMEVKSSNGYSTIEEAVGIDTISMVNNLTDIIKEISSKYKTLVHIHQYKGSTDLDVVLSNATGVECILDETNYYEHPVDYVTQYPNIEFLLSLSQCAGLDAVAGEWIIPESFMRYDVENGIVFTTKETDFEICSEFDVSKFNPKTGNILYVNDLWNPGPDDPGVLMFDDEDENVWNFVIESTKNFDWSHNHEHALAVATTACSILNTKDVLHLALLHDICDHKYPESIDRNELSEWMFENLRSTKYRSHSLVSHIDSLIDRVSFSKQKSTEKYDETLIVVRDADRLEALGDKGIKRCIEVSNKLKLRVPDNVIKHCYDKLLKLLPKGYIVTNKARELAVPLHNQIVKYVRSNLINATFDYMPPQYLKLVEGQLIKIDSLEG